MGKITKKEIVTQFLFDNKGISSARAAREVLKQYPLYFKDVENARYVVRGVRGANGKHGKGGVGGYRPVIELMRGQDEIKNWIAGMPEAVNIDWEPYIITTTDIKYLVLGDIHAPYHDPVALECAINHGIEQGCKGVIYLGDAIDFYQISKFTRDPKAPDVQYEINTLLLIFNLVNKRLKPKKVIFKMGNHDLRMAHYLRTQAPQLAGLNVLKEKNLFRLDEFGIEVVEAGVPIKYKGLTLLHGHEYGGGANNPVNPARGMWLKANDSVVSAHLHKSSEHTEQSINGRIYTCWSIGCLCFMHQEYASLNKWNAGFGILHPGVGNTWDFESKRIIEGKIY